MTDLEVRVDPFNGSRVIIAPGRTTRPGGEFQVSKPDSIDEDKDPFLAGHEDRTPPELFALVADQSPPPDTAVTRSPDAWVMGSESESGTNTNTPHVEGSDEASDAAMVEPPSDTKIARPSTWQVRVVPNLYPALREDAPEPPQHHNVDLFSAFAANGSHEVIINSPAPVTSLTDLSLAELETAMSIWQRRMRHHSESSYVHMSVNEQPRGGASLPHTHGQLYALDFVPAVVARERERFAAYATRTMGGNLMTDLIAEEVRQQDRMITIDDDAVLLTPYASRTPYHLMIAPRGAFSSYEESSFTAAPILYEALKRLKKLLGETPPLNIWVRTAPKGSDHFSWRIEIFPRLTNLAAFELGTEVFICTLSPEVAAANLRAV